MTSPDTYELRIVSYNAFLRPAAVDAMFMFRDQAVCRAPLIGAQLRAEAADVIALQETQHDTALSELTQTLEATYPYKVLGEPAAFGWTDTRAVNGGVSLLSRYPFEYVDTVAFSACTKEDCLARKGFVYARIRLSPELRVNVVATHLNSHSPEDAQGVRKQQLVQMRRYMESRPEFKTWPTVVVGDMNVDGLKPFSKGDQEYNSMMTSLTSAALGGRPLDSLVEHLGVTPLFGDLGNSRNCTRSRVTPCESPNQPSRAHMRRRYDYVFVYPHERFSAQFKASGMVDYTTEDELCGARYLSDHKAVRVTLSLQHNKVYSTTQWVKR